MYKQTKAIRSILHIGLFIVLTTLLIGVSAGLSSGSFSSNKTLHVSCESGFYRLPVLLRITAPRGSAIYYTTDGTDPSTLEDTVTRYTHPLLLNTGRKEKCYHLRAVYRSRDGKISPVFDYTYIIGMNMDKRFSSETYVAEITGDPEELFGYENGIFVEGALRDTYLARNPDKEPYAMDPAGYNLRGPQSERAVNVQLFNSAGKLLLSQNCGLRIFGNFSRGKMQKSFQLFARNSYARGGNDTASAAAAENIVGTNTESIGSADIDAGVGASSSGYGHFDLALFPDQIKTADGTILERSNRLVFRNSGNDFAQAFIHDTLIQKLASESGFPLTTNYVPAAVYINGDYYGFYWVKEPFSDSKLKQLYADTAAADRTTAAAKQLIPGKDSVSEESDGRFERVTVNEFYKKPEDDTEPLADDYQKLYDEFAEADFNDEETFERLCRRIDLDNYLMYYALEIYIANKDWPYNNVQAWKYVSDRPRSDYFDGRYRYLLFDTDYGFGLSDDVPGYAVDEDNLSVLLNNYQSPLFCNLMARTDCRGIFARYLCDLMGSVFSYENVSRELDALITLRDPELNYYVTENLQGITDMNSVQVKTEEIRNFALARPDHMRTFLQNDYALFHPYILRVEAPGSARISVNSIGDCSEFADEKGIFSNIYYADMSLKLTALPDSGHLFDHWEIDGQIFSDPELLLGSDELMAMTGIDPEDHSWSTCPELTVKAVMTDDSGARLSISRIHAHGSEDIIELFNPSEHPISMKGYYLSDTDENLLLFALPDKELAPGETLMIYGGKSRLYNYLGKLKLNFSLRKEETLYLSDREGNITEQILIPDLARDDTYYTKDHFTGRFSETID